MAVLNAPTRAGMRCRLKRLLYFWLMTVGLLFAGMQESAAQTGISREYQIKAVFLFDFAQFVDWPANIFAEARSPLTIGVLGNDPFGSFLDQTVQGEQVNGHPLAVQRYRRVEDIRACQILFISQSETKSLRDILAALKGQSILTVGESEHFAEAGGMIRFVKERNKIRLRINLDAAKAANLTLSSKLLQAAEIVKTGKD